MTRIILLSKQDLGMFGDITRQVGTRDCQRTMRDLSEAGGARSTSGIRFSLNTPPNTYE